MVKLDPDEVYEVGYKTRQFSEDLKSSGPLKEVAVDERSFGELDEARDFVFVHGAAQKKVEETIAWVSQTLDDFGTGLQKSVEGLRAVEDGVQAVMTVFSSIGTGLPIPSVDPTTSIDENALNNISEIPGIGPNDSGTAGSDA